MLGIIAFIGILLVLVLAHEWGHFITARLSGVKVEEFGFGFPPRLTAWQGRVTTYSINWLPLGGFVRLKGEDNVDPNAAADADSFATQGIIKRATIIVAGVFMNIVVAVVLLAIGYTVGLPELLGNSVPAGATVTDSKHQIVNVLPGSPAATTLQPGDVIASVDGQQFLLLSDLQNYIRAYPTRDTTRPMQLSVNRAGQEQNIPLAPTMLTTASGQQAYGVGVELASSGLVSYPFTRAVVVAAQTVGETIKLIFITLYQLIAQLVAGHPEGAEVAGPVGIARIAGDAAGLGWRYLLSFGAILSINLAVINVLPIPGLDGGRLFFLAYEAVFRRRVSAETEGRIHRWGFLTLLLLVLVITAVDINRLVRH